MVRRVVSLIVVGAMLLAGCGSNTTATADQPGKTTNPLDDLPPIDPTVMTVHLGAGDGLQTPTPWQRPRGPL